MHELHGLSYREYLKFRYGLEMPVITLEQLIETPFEIRKLMDSSFRPLKFFMEYLSSGYYPFFKEDIQGYHQRLQQLIRLVVEYDMAELRDFDIRNAKKLLQLLYILAENVPFKPNLTKLAEKSSIHRNSVSSYLNYLEQARLINQIYAAGISTSILQKPEKIYLNNPNLSSVLSIVDPDKGNLRETFFLSQIIVHNELHYPGKGDFIVNGKWTFEIGGRSKTKSQISSVENAFLVKDDLEYPVAGSLPLWLFGFIY